MENKKNLKIDKIKKEVISWITTIVSAIIIVYLITTFVIVNAKVPTGSMKNTIMPNDRLIAFRMSYMFSEPEREDIVVFRYPDDEEVLYVKRIIGLPGDTVDIVDGKVYINGSDEPLIEDYVTVEEMQGSWDTFEVPEDCYFMLGDNRNDSNDSRYWTNPFVSKDKILGKVVFKYYPKIQFFN